MKPCLPLLLRRCLLSALAAGCGVTCTDYAYAGYMHADATIITYTDFAQNCGRYVVGNTNALLDYINRDGVKITYTGGQDDYTMAHGMIDFSSQCDGGYGAAIGYNFYATVQHNGVHNNTYTGNYIGSGNAIHYQGIEYKQSSNYTFLHGSGNDYKVTRQSKLITDVTGSTVYGSTTGDYSGLTDGSLRGETLYRAGSGTMGVYDTSGNGTGLCGAYAYITGAMQEISSTSLVNSSNGSMSVHLNMKYTSEGVTDSSPLPYAARAGDSGSPSWVWNEDSGQYEYISALSAGNLVCYSKYQGAPEYTANVMASYDKKVTIASDNAVYINEVATAGESITDGTRTATPYSGTVTDSSGTQITSFVGVQSGINTWKDLSGLKDTDNWYSYGADYLNASNSMAETANGVLNYADLYMTENLVFTASSSEETQNILMNADVDLGLGYAQFSLGEGQESASFRLASAEGNNYLLNSAGFVVDKGVTLTVELTNPAEYMREWRKLGEGDLRIAGNGNNDVFLNVGGSGASYGESVTYLEREGGYAAYNVLANNGATVVIRDTDQIKRDFTFGYRGGYLDMNGNSMTWNNGNDASADGFTIHALDEGARITNGAEQDVTLTWTQGGDQTWLGSFVDQSGKGALSFIYNGGEGASLTMHSIYTNLANEGSGITVQSGTLALEGTNTVHGMGSQSGTNANRYSSADDWHYADTASDVTVQNGGTFRLGSHARLTGDVTVESGGTFVMNEGVRHQYEYIEGGQVKEDTEAVSAYFGLKGNVNLAEGSAMKVQFSEGTDSTLTYAGNISGTGSFVGELGTSGAKLLLSGNNSFSGTKEMLSGTLVAASAASLGNTADNKWMIGENAGIAFLDYTSSAQTAEFLNSIDGASTGVLALTFDIAGEISLENHQGLIIGAMEGNAVQYGTTDVELTAVDGKWTLGGGGGELKVNFKLTGENQLVVGNEYGSGVVTLTNAENDFSGGIILAGGVTLDYTDEAALGSSKIKLDYTNRIFTPSTLVNIEEGTSGILLADRVADKDLDMSLASNAVLGANGDVVYTGKITLAEGGAYRFGGVTGSLTLDTVLESGHDMVLDGQTFSGGKVVFNKVQSDFNGAVSVMGRNSSQTTSTAGNITMTFGADNALSSASSVKLLSGGIIDLNGTLQTLNNVATDSGSSVVDSAGDGTLVIHSTENTSLSGALNIAHVEKTGSASLTLWGSNTYETFRLREGTAYVGNASALCSKGIFSVESGATLDVGGGKKIDGSISLNNGRLYIGATGDWNTAEAWINNTIYVAGGTENVIVSKAYVSWIWQTSPATNYLEGNIEMAEGTMLTMQGALYSLSGASMGSAGATLVYQGSQFSLKNTNTTFNGTLLLNGASNVNLLTMGHDSSVVTFNRLEAVMTNSSQLVLQENTGSTLWKIHELVGTSDILWSSSQDKSNASRMILDGEGDFSGNLTLNRSGGTHSSYIELKHERALQNATVTLAGNSDTNCAVLALNTDNATIKGMNATNDKTWIFAGEAPTSGSAAPTSSRQTVLTITGSGTYDFKGNVSGGDAGTDNGIALVMDGTGEQTFSGSSIALRRVEVNRGILNLNATGLEIAGDISLNRGAAISFGTVTDGVYSANGTYALESGQSLIVSGNIEKGSATVNGSLCLNGGVLSFEGDSLNAESAAFSVSGTAFAGDALGSQEILISGTSVLKEGSYFLSSGDWSSVDASRFTTSLNYLSAEFTTATTGLTMTLQTADGYVIWSGTDTSREWNKTTFGDAEKMPKATDTVAFNDSSASNAVLVSASTSAEALLFDATGNVSISVENDARLTVDSVRQIGTGTTTLDDGVIVTGRTCIEDGELVVQGTASLNGGVSGKGVLSVDWGDQASSVAGIEDLGELRVLSGRYLADKAVSADMIRVKDGAQLCIADGVAMESNIELSGNGWAASHASDANGAVRMENGVSIGGGVSLGNHAELNVETGSASLLGALDTKDYTLSKTGAGTLVLGCNGTQCNLVVQGGSVSLASSTAMTAEGSLTMKNGTSLALNGYTANGAIYLENGSSVQGSGTISGSLHVAGDSTATLNNNGTGGLLVAAVDVETGGVLNAEASNKAITVSGMSGNGAVNLNTTMDNTGTTAVTVNGANTGFGGHLSINGARDLGTRVQFANADSFGTGKFTVNGATFWIATQNTAETAVAATIDVGEKGTTINGSSGKNYYFTNLSGIGAVYTCLGNGSVTFLGDVSEFSGTIDSRNANYTFAFGGEGVNYHDVLGKSTNETVNLFASNEDGTAAVRLTGNTSANINLTYRFQYSDDVVANAVIANNSNVEQNGTGTLVLDQQNTYTGKTSVNAGNLVVSGSVGTESGNNEYAVAADSKLVLRGNGKIANRGVAVQNNTAAQGIALCSAEVDDSDGFIHNVTVTDSGISVTDQERRGTMENVTVTVTSDSFDISEIDMKDTVVRISSSLKMTGVTMDVDTCVFGTGDRVANAALYDVSLAVTRDAVAAEDASVYGAEGTTVYVYEIANFDNVNLSGTLTLDLSGLEDRASDGTSVVALDFGDSVTLEDVFSVMVLYDHSTYVSDTLTQSGSAVLINASKAIPEPTTSSLVMIGLAAGILRRRRTASAK